MIEKLSKSNPSNNMDTQKSVQAESDVETKDRVEQPELDNDQQTGLPEVHVLYLNIPPSDEPQVLDLSSLLAQEGIQMVESSESADQIPDDCHVNGSQDIVIESDSGAGVTVISNHSETQSKRQSAHALLHLSKSQSDGSDLQVSDILAAHRHSEHVMSEEEQNTSAEALLQLSSETGTGTYIVDENGTMIPITHMRSNTLLEVEDTGVTTIAICQCWCGREFISQEDLDRHKLAHKYQTQGRMNPGIQKCTLCLESFMSHKELRVHHAEVHPGGMPWECNICNRMFPKKIAMKAHMRVHSTLTRYQCSSCKKVFFYKTALNRHLKMHSYEKPFKCTICGDMYHSLWDLRKHRMNHQPPKLFACDICTKVFKQKQTLFVHSRIHTGQKPYSCEVCHRNFSLKSTLVQHRRIHTGEKPNVCHVCQRAFRQNSTLKAHLRTHTNLRPFMCRYCKMRFAYKDEVAEHEHTHAQNKTWQCEECGMWFKNQSLLSRHSRVHTNERPFHCNVCYKSFVQSGSLQSHMRSHTKEKPYQCRICAKAYYTSGTLLVHIRKFHNVDAKSVKDVFPVYNFIEDQKVFTIRNSLMSDLKSAEASGDRDEAGGAEKANLEDLLNKDNTIIEELVEDSSEISMTDSRGLPGGHISLVVEGNSSENCLKEDDADQIRALHKDKKNSARKMAGAGKKKAKKGTDHKVKRLMLPEQVEEEALLEANSEEQREEQVSQNSHTALDRQEAALGLAELSLTGGEEMHLEKPAAKTRTFFREEEEDESDPNVTKIILSKEGGIMNSQDPHQCPVCGRIFGRKSIMIEHIRIHTDEKPYECDFCQASFRQNAQLRSHIRNRHTQVERYQCSFCHKRFLSRSITIRHINFHHKLKLKFCHNSDPEWTVDHAVWSDDSFELSVSNSQFLKTGAKKTVSKRPNDSARAAEAVPETDKRVDSARPAEGNSKYVIKVSLPPVAGIDTENEEAQKSGPAERAGQFSVGNSASSDLSSISSSKPHQESSVDLSDPESQSQTAVSPDSSTTAATTKNEGIDRPLEASKSVKVSVETDFGNSRLLCGTCAMQFRGVSSLRHHLRKVHNTTLDQSDVSYMYEDDGLQKTQMRMSSAVDAEAGMAQADGRCNKQKEESDNPCGSVKIVVYDDSKKCVDNPSNMGMPYACRMCSLKYISKAGLEDHMKSHSEEDIEKVGLHRCDVCFSVMKNTQQVAKHILKFHGVKQVYVCSICHREFFQQSSVLRHMKFLHKWEIKIRGEASIPILVKPAPSSIHAPNSVLPTLRVSRESLLEQMRTPATKSDCGDEENVTYISLEIGDMENLQIFKDDGQEVSFEVVASDDKVKTLKIREDDSNSAKTEAKILDAPQKPITGEDVGSHISGQSVCASAANVAETLTNTVPEATSSSPSASVTRSIHEATTTDPSSFIIIGNDRSTPVTVSREIISQLVAALRSSSQENKLDSRESISRVIKIKSLGNISGRSQSDTDSFDKTKTELGQECRVMPQENTLKSDELTPESDAATLPDSSNSSAPIIMSVKDIGATYAGCQPKMGHLKTNDTAGTRVTACENADTDSSSEFTTSNGLNCHSDISTSMMSKIEMGTGRSLDMKEKLTETKLAAAHQKRSRVAVVEKTQDRTTPTVMTGRVSDNKTGKNQEKTIKNKPAASRSVGHVGDAQVRNAHVQGAGKAVRPERNKMKKRAKVLTDNSGIPSCQKSVNSENISDIDPSKLRGFNRSQKTLTVKENETRTNHLRKCSTQPVSSNKLTPNSDSTSVPNTKLSQKLTTSATKISENSSRPAEERRSSSGRLIKKKLFIDEVEEAVEVKRRRKKQ